MVLDNQTEITEETMKPDIFVWTGSVQLISGLIACSYTVLLLLRKGTSRYFILPMSDIGATVVTSLSLLSSSYNNKEINHSCPMEMKIEMIFLAMLLNGFTSIMAYSFQNYDDCGISISKHNINRLKYMAGLFLQWGFPLIVCFTIYSIGLSENTSKKTDKTELPCIIIFPQYKFINECEWSKWNDNINNTKLIKTTTVQYDTHLNKSSNKINEHEKITELIIEKIYKLMQESISSEKETEFNSFPSTDILHNISKRQLDEDKNFEIGGQIAYNDSSSLIENEEELLPDSSASDVDTTAHMNITDPITSPGLLEMVFSDEENITLGEGIENTLTFNDSDVHQTTERPESTNISIEKIIMESTMPPNTALGSTFEEELDIPIATDSLPSTEFTSQTNLMNQPNNITLNHNKEEETDIKVNLTEFQTGNGTDHECNIFCTARKNKLQQNTAILILLSWCIFITLGIFTYNLLHSKLQIQSKVCLENEKEQVQTIKNLNTIQSAVVGNGMVLHLIIACVLQSTPLTIQIVLQAFFCTNGSLTLTELMLVHAITHGTIRSIIIVKYLYKLTKKCRNRNILGKKQRTISPKSSENEDHGKKVFFERKRSNSSSEINTQDIN